MTLMHHAAADQLFKSLVLPGLSYGVECWGPMVLAEMGQYPEGSLIHQALVDNLALYISRDARREPAHAVRSRAQREPMLDRGRGQNPGPAGRRHQGP